MRIQGQAAHACRAALIQEKRSGWRAQRPAVALTRSSSAVKPSDAGSSSASAHKPACAST